MLNISRELDPRTSLWPKTSAYSHETYTSQYAVIILTVEVAVQRGGCCFAHADSCFFGWLRLLIFEVFCYPLRQWATYIRGRFGTHSFITSKPCTQPHGECGRVVRWPSALGWWCRRHRACHSSYNWDGMPGLAGPFHLHPAVRWEIQKIQELIMSLLGFCSTVWCWNQPPLSHLHHHQDHYMLPLHTHPPPPPLILQPL